MMPPPPPPPVPPPPPQEKEKEKSKADVPLSKLSERAENVKSVLALLN